MYHELRKRGTRASCRRARGATGSGEFAVAINDCKNARSSECRNEPLESAMTRGRSGIIYKICSEAMWQEAQHAGVLHGAEVDRRDGFIHFSTAAQVRETAARHFAAAGDLILVAVAADALGADLRWEPSRGGDLFPHLYATLPIAAVLWAKPLPLGGDGQHVFPELTA
jgi:uncharacterized protein (DUF952 family)